MSGIDGAPWWAKWISGLVVQAGLAWSQYLAHVGEHGLWGLLGVAAAQAVTGVAMVYGPGAASRLARGVGDAVSRGRKAEEPKP